MTSHPDRWLLRFRPVPGAQSRLVCFPHAGGTAAFYRPWLELLPPQLELAAVKYPGGLDRPAEEGMTDIAAMADEIGKAISAVPGPAVALFGHSLGAIVAYEVARRLDSASAGPPLRRLIVSGRPGPGHLDRRSRHLADDGALCAELRELGGTPAAALEHPELRELVLYALRIDYRMAESYRPRPGPPLACPVTAMSADDDPEAPPPLVRDWARTTTGAFTVRTFRGGGHFYLIRRRTAVVAEVLRPTLPDGAGP
jgi:pyochelin biosynthetic protein PchC